MSETLRFRADTNGKIYTSSGTPPSGTPADGNTVAEWRDQETPATRDRSMASSGDPAWSSPGPMRSPSINFDGDDFFGTLQVDSTSVASNTFLAAAGSALLNGSKSIIIAFRMTAAATNNANIYDNTPLITDTGGLIGIHFKTIAGLHYVYAYNWDGTADVTTGIQVQLDTDYVLQYRHDGATLSLSLLSGTNGGTRSDQSASSGGTSNGSGRNLRVGRVYSATATYFTGYIGEIYCDNADVGSTNSTLTEIVGRWLPSGPTYTLAADSGSFVVTGNDVGLLVARHVAPSAGAFSLAGENVGLIASRLLSCSLATFSLAGNSVDLTYTPIGGDGTPGSSGVSVCVGMSL